MFIDKQITPEGDVYLKYFFMDTSLNDRGWAASPDWIDVIANTAKGASVTVVRDIKDSIRPGVPTGDYHAFHPQPGATPLMDREWAKKFEWAKVVDVVPSAPERLAANSKMKNHIGDSIIPSGIYKSFDQILKVTDPDVAKAIREGRTDVIPPEVSPGIIWYSGPQHAVEQAYVVHVASVPMGAYGPKAKQIAQCVGGDGCRRELLAASIPIINNEPQNYFESITTNIEQFHNDNTEPFRPSSEKPPPPFVYNESITNDDPNSIPPYVERTGGCPLVALSSLVSQNGFSSNSMSFNNTSSGLSTRPHTYGTSIYQGPTGNLIGKQTSSNKGFQVTSQTPQQNKSKLKVTIKSPKRFLKQNQNQNQNQALKPEIANKLATPQVNADHHKSPEELEKEKQEQENNKEGTISNLNQEVALPNNEPKADKAIQELERMKAEVAAERRRWTVATLIPREEFMNKNGKVLEKEWLKSIDEAIAKGWTDDHIIEYYELKRQARAAQQVPQLAQVAVAARQPMGKLGASSISASNNSDSSQSAPYDYETTVKCIKLFGGKI